MTKLVVLEEEGEKAISLSLTLLEHEISHVTIGAHGDH